MSSDTSVLITSNLTNDVVKTNETLAVIRDTYVVVWSNPFVRKDTRNVVRDGCDDQ